MLIRIPAPSRPAAGFTLVELVTIILIVGILAAFAVPRMLGRSDVEPVTASNTVLSAAHRARQLAMTKGSAANVQLIPDSANNRIRITYTDPATGLQVLDFALPADITVSGPDIAYDGLGNASPAPTTLSVDPGADVCIETTGYARLC
ncbi:MAG: pilus assembly FimT family protein [Alphaproteobacteria bacterium]